MRSRNKCLTLMYDGPVGWWRNACDDASKILSIEKLQPGQLNERTRGGCGKKTWESKTLARKSAPEVWFANTQTELHKYTKTNTFRQSPTVARSVVEFLEWKWRYDMHDIGYLSYNISIDVWTCKSIIDYLICSRALWWWYHISFMVFTCPWLLHFVQYFVLHLY